MSIRAFTPEYLLTREVYSGVAVLICIVYIAIFATLSINRHYSFHTQMNDLGNMTQAIAQAANGKMFMPVTNDTDGIVRSRFGIHANLIFWLFAIPFHFLPYQEFLLILGSVACGMCGLGLYFYARYHLRNSAIALLPALTFWASPIVHDANLYDFHVITCAASFLIWMLWAFDRGSPVMGCILCALALSCKEDVPLMMMLVGFHYYRTGKTTLGLSIALSSGIYFALLMFFVIPFFRNGAELSNVVAERYSWLGSSVPQIVSSVLRDPGSVLGHLLNVERIKLPLYLLVSGGFAALRAPVLLSSVIPSIAIALLSGPFWMTRISGTYYWVPSIAIILAAVVLSARHSPRLSWRVVLPFAVTAVLSLALSPAPHGFQSNASFLTVDQAGRQLLAKAKGIIPPEASVSGQNNIAVHFATRDDVAAYPLRSKTAEYLVFYLRTPAGPNPVLFPSASPAFLFQMSPLELIDEVEQNLQAVDRELLMSEQKFYIFRKSRGMSVMATERSIHPSVWQEFLADASEHKNALCLGAITFYCGVLVGVICLVYVGAHKEDIAIL